MWLIFECGLVISISYNNVDKDMAELRRASRRKWWSPTRMCDWYVFCGFSYLKHQKMFEMLWIPENIDVFRKMLENA